MRVTDSLMGRNFLSSIADLYERLESADKQLSTGRRLNNLHDSPSGGAEAVRLRSQLDDVDQYRANTDSSALFVGTADSALASAFDIVTQIFTSGSAAASNYQSASVRATLANEVRSLRDQLLALGNTEVQGRYLFAGSLVTAPAFTISGDTVTYQGDGVINQVEIGDGLTVDQGVAGSAAFSPIFATIETLLAAIDSNDWNGIRTALSQISAARDTISAQRERLGVSLAELERSRADQDNLELNLRTQTSRIEDANLAEAVSDFTRIQTALRAAMTARTQSQQSNLFDYLG